jgi:hypothetical protein
MIGRYINECPTRSDIMDDDEVLLLDLIRIMDGQGMLERKILERMLIELDKKGITLIPIIADINGFSTPSLRYKIDEYFIYRIIDGNDTLNVTKEGKDYIEEKVSSIKGTAKHDGFVGTVMSLLKKMSS